MTTESAAAPETLTVAFIGLGNMGGPMAANLARAGHEVTVVDRQPAAALETSFANAAQISPGYSAPWAARSVRACGR